MAWRQCYNWESAFYGRVSQLVPVRPSGQRQCPLSASQTELPGPQSQLIVQLTPYRPTSHAAYNIALIIIFVDHFSRPRRAIGPLCVCVCVWMITFEWNDQWPRYLLRLRERWRSIVMRTSVCLSASTSPEPYARPLPFSLCMLPVAVARSSSDRVTKSQGERAILGVVRAIQKHRQSSLPPSMPSSLQRDHSVFQSSANRNPENSERRWCSLLVGKWVTRVHSAGEVWYLQFPC